MHIPSRTGTKITYNWWLIYKKPHHEFESRDICEKTFLYYSLWDKWQIPWNRKLILESKKYCFQDIFRQHRHSQNFYSIHIWGPRFLWRIVSLSFHIGNNGKVPRKRKLISEINKNCYNICPAYVVDWITRNHWDGIHLCGSRCGIQTIYIHKMNLLKADHFFSY